MMATAQISSLLQPPDAKLSSDRALEFLDARFTSLDQLRASGELERLGQETRARSDKLNLEADKSGGNAKEVLARTLAAAHAQQTAAKEMALTRHALKDELAALADELVSTSSGPDRQPTLLEELETLQRSLRELESVRDYVRVVDHSLRLSEDAATLWQHRRADLSSTHPSIEKYKELQVFVRKVSAVCVPMEGTTISLVAFVESVQRRAWTNIREALSSALLSAAEVLQWPMPILYEKTPETARTTFEAAFLDLLKLQQIGETLHPMGDGDDSARRTALYALQALVQPVALRFKFHFDGDRQTNRLDKPEWYFTHILNASHEHRAFMETYVQQLLSRSKYSSVDAWREFTRLLLPMLARKIRSTVPTLLTHSSLLAHTIYQALAFDAALRDAGFSLEQTLADNNESEWEGISDVILGRTEWFEAWIDGERRFAEDQYLEIISTSDAWQIADDAGEEEEDIPRGELRPTNSARRVKALVEQITDRYQALPRFAQRLRFLLHVQLPVLDQYRARISSSLDAFETLSSAFVRAVPGGLTGQPDLQPGRLTAGVDGATRLVKALISARWIASAMKTWGEDVFFLELWTEICRRPALRSIAEESGALPAPPSDATADEDVPEGTVFDSVLGAYDALCVRAEDMVARQIVSDVESELRDYFASSWETEDEGAALRVPLAALSAHLALLRGTLPPARVAALHRRVAGALASALVQRGIVYRGRARASLPAARRFAVEARLWPETARIALAIDARRAEAPWSRLLGGATLLALEDGFARTVKVVLEGTDDEFDRAMDELGVRDVERGEARDIVRAREDCPR